ncbi:hypothetical protein [Gordonia sp. 852002-51296_SCH5728562-b]|uniref:hypothetical protein n=1 Tax=Gordonia sp. 852002-51296_SCH5728562-b TaxID=1834101 RepID=UPI0007EBDD19|nr:hypothetical protein [Gordonia sp. 852002-51296_SCH5728562-b]OBA37423.1 hypothetical protein A5766_06840 [Gordonia sp. 852002-51296_SCH5728562-b]
MAKSFRITATRAATDAEIEYRKRRDALAESQLAAVRSAAQNWRNSIGLGTLASTLVGLVATPDIIKAQSNQQIADAAWLLGIGVLGATIAFICALRASFGWPRLHALTTENDFRRWQSNETATTICYLRFSVFFTLIAFVSLCLGYAVLLFHIPLPLHFPTWQS